MHQLSEIESCFLLNFMKLFSFLRGELAVILAYTFLLCPSDNANEGCPSKALLTSDSGTITSINYPNPYDKNLNCTWTILASSSMVSGNVMVVTWKTSKVSYLKGMGSESKMEFVLHFLLTKMLFVL